MSFIKEMKDSPFYKEEGVTSLLGRDVTETSIIEEDVSPTLKIACIINIHFDLAKLHNLMGAREAIEFFNGWRQELENISKEITNNTPYAYEKSEVLRIVSNLKMKFEELNSTLIIPIPITFVSVSRVECDHVPEKLDINYSTPRRTHIYITESASIALGFRKAEESYNSLKIKEAYNYSVVPVEYEIKDQKCRGYILETRTPSIKISEPPGYFIFTDYIYSLIYFENEGEALRSYQLFNKKKAKYTICYPRHTSGNHVICILWVEVDLSLLLKYSFGMPCLVSRKDEIVLQIDVKGNYKNMLYDFCEDVTEQGICISAYALPYCINYHREKMSGIFFAKKIPFYVYKEGEEELEVCDLNCALSRIAKLEQVVVDVKK